MRVMAEYNVAELEVLGGQMQRNAVPQMHLPIMPSYNIIVSQMVSI